MAHAYTCKRRPILHSSSVRLIIARMALQPRPESADTRPLRVPSPLGRSSIEIDVQKWSVFRNVAKRRCLAERRRGERERRDSFEVTTADRQRPPPRDPRLLVSARRQR